MTFEYVSVDEAIGRPGLRMIVVGGTPSPWGEAAKGFFHVKKLDWVAVRLDYRDEKLKAWAGQRSGPVAFLDGERPRSGWSEILLLAERLAPSPPLLPADLADRALVFGLAHELCGEGGLGWIRRLQLVHAGLNGGDGFAEPVARYLAKKYGYRAEEAEAYDDRVVGLLAMLAARLRAQEEAGSRYYVGDSLTAVDVYSATFMALFKPLPPEQRPNDTGGTAFGVLDDRTEAALDPVLLRHRDMMYAEHLELPLSL
ncbi:MAG: hypothetical protein R3D45_06295 [Rhizobiaceae bacterium]